MNENSKGNLVVISGPSGVGKTTVLRELIEKCPLPLQMSVSATTRPIRPGEVEGVNYYYLTDEEFKQRKEAGEFLECVEVFGRGHWYGTLRETVSTGLNQGKWVILEIDVIGATKILENFPDATTIFIHPGSIEELEKRLRGRGTEDETALLRRLEVARGELDMAHIYQYIVNNQTVDQTVEDICQLLVKSGEQPECTTN